MTRLDFERREGASRGKTPNAMHADGFYSAICDCRLEDCCGWQCIRVPGGLDRRETQRMLKDFHGLRPQRFGGS